MSGTGFRAVEKDHKFTKQDPKDTQESGTTISIAGRQIPSLLSSKNTEPWVQTQTVLTFNVVKRCREICMSFFLPEEVNCRLQDRIAGHSSTTTETT